jgi:hypothetical protein
MSLSDKRELARALGVAAHPLRLDLLEAFSVSAVRSPTDAALLLGEPLGNVRHHVRVLESEGFLEDPREPPGDAESEYRPTRRARELVEALAALA